MPSVRVNAFPPPFPRPASNRQAVRSNRMNIASVNVIAFTRGKRQHQ